MIEPKEHLIKKPDGTEVSYILSKFPAVAGREIMAKYPLSSIPKLGDYSTNEEVMLKLMSYVAVEREGKTIQLTTKTLVDNHVDSWETLGRIEIAMMGYNCSFFRDGRILSFFADIAQKLPQWISKILTDSLASLSAKEKPPSTN